jgi:2',3'-cyclic-nucleotide 2'-phosphodiesterase (5'-nucleotidase family)
MNILLCYNVFAKDGHKMKKIISIIGLLLLMILVSACTTEVGPKDTIPPEILGLNDITYTIGDDEPDYLDGVLAIDNVDGDVTHQIIVDDSAVDLTTVGAYELFYSVKDSSNNMYRVYVMVYVVEELIDLDTTPPNINGTKDITYYIGDDAPDYLKNVTANDNIDGNITHNIVVEDDTVDLLSEGVYTLTYRVSDQAGNESIVTVTVTVINQISHIEFLNIYHVNDTHGALLNDGNQMGISRIGNLILDEKANHPDNTIFISSGDMLQGTLISNYFYGASVIDTLNASQMDAFTLGNHEFDWGLEVVTEYFNPDTEGLKANFPLLGANVFFKGTTTRPDFVDAYTIIEKGNVKIGVIGLMGFGLESSIATSRVEDYYFDDPIPWTAYYAEHLRTVEDVDIVIVSIHGNSQFTNQGIGNLTGNQRVDVLFNGHSHSTYETFISRNGVDLPIMQSGANGSAVGKVHLALNENGEVLSYTAQNLNRFSESRLNTPSSLIDAVLSEYLHEVDALLNETIIISGSYYSRNDLTEYMAKLIRTSVDADFGIHNYGGTRANLDSGQNITVATLYEIFPFDNKIKTVELLGSEIKSYISNSGSVFVSYGSGLTYENIQNNTYYLVATNDYVFDLTSNPFIYGENPIDTGILIRDLWETVLRNRAEISNYFYINDPIILEMSVYPTQLDIFDRRQYLII